jgi:dipeptidyl aminopeptidase/acylaminoacyl peptidase
MTRDSRRWVGTDEHGGLPSMPRPDAPVAIDWDLEAIAAVERPHDPVVSPDGSVISFMWDRGDTSDIWTIPVSGGSPSRVSVGRGPEPYWEDEPATWSPDGSRLAYTRDGWVWVVDAGGGHPAKICEASSPAWLTSSTLAVVVERKGESRIARVEVEDPWPVALTSPGQNVGGLSVSAKGSRIFFVDYPDSDRNRSDIWVLDTETGETRRLTGVEGMHDRSPRLSPDETTVAFTSERSGWYEIHLVDLATGESSQLTKGDADFSGLEWHPDGARLVAVRSRRGKADLVSVDLQGRVDIILAGGEWANPGWSGDSVVVVHERHNMPPRLIRVDPDGAVVSLLGPPPASIARARYVPYEEVTYNSFDGLEIHGFLFRPEAAATSAVPAIVYPHGGPTSAYTDAWDGHLQYFVEKGYAWLAINFRGSTSYGREFERSNHGVWCVDDTEDCLAAADFLAGLDWIDSERLAIFGASYGSYMALASLVRDPNNRYACGVAKYGDSDAATSWAQGDRGGREDVERMMGRPSQDRQGYRDASPLARVGEIERPILIAHGELDARVPPRQSEQLAAALRRLGKTYEYVTYPTESHGFLRAGPQVDFYRRMERFLDWYLM